MSTNSSITFFFIVLILSLVVFSCDLNQAEEPVLLRTDSFSGFTASNADRWVIISDSRGKIIDYKNTSDTEGVLEFRGLAGGTITVTELNIFSFEHGNETLLRHNLTSYFGVPIGNSYFVSESENSGTPLPDPVGKAQIRLNNYSESDDPWYAIGFSDGFNSFNAWLDYDTHTYDGSTFMADMNLREDPMDIFITSYKGSDPVYAWLRDVNVGDSVVLDFDDFSPMTTVPINKSIHNAYIMGQNEPELSARRHFLSWTEYWRYANYSNPGGNPSIGYIDGFNYYDVYAQIGPMLCCSPHERVAYNKLGTSVPASIHLPDYSFSLSEDNLFSLNYTFDRPYTRKNFNFSIDEADNNLRWNIHAPEGVEIKAPKIPIEIQANYPFLNSGNLPLRTARFVESLDGNTYEDFIKIRLEKVFKREPFEELEYFFMF